jgi:hypothetical protein
MKHTREHFEREAEQCVPHLSHKERQKWIDKCHREHPGFTTKHLTGQHLSPALQTKHIKRMWFAIGFFVLVLIILAVKVLHAQDDTPLPPVPPADLPLPVEPSDRERLKDLWVQAFISAVQVQDANLAVEKYSRAAAEAKLDAAKRQRELDEMNTRIAAQIGDFRTKYKAGEKWCLTRQLGWAPKQGDKPCPAIFESEAPQSQQPSR